MKNDIESSTTTTTTMDNGLEGSGLFGKRGYKLWVLAAIVCLAICSFLTASVILRSSTRNIITSLHTNNNLDLPALDDLDILEVEDKEKVVKKRWEVYIHSPTTRLPRFWREAFEAAYESMSSDVPAIRDATISEIAKMSLRLSNH